jgi:hypothetical protein
METTATMTWMIMTIAHAIELKYSRKQVPPAQAKRKPRTNIKGTEHFIEAAKTADLHSRR